MQSIELTTKTLWLNQYGNRYQIHVPTGQTFVMMGEVAIPLQGCKFPSEWASARFWLFVHLNFKWILGAGLLILSVAMLQLCLALTYPGDIQAHFIAVFSFWMNSALVVGFSLCCIAAFTYYFFKGNVEVTFGKEEPQALLGSGEISIAPDVLIMALSADEAPESFEQRMNAAFEQSDSTQQWVLVVAPRQATFAVKKNTDLDGSLSASVFIRSRPFDATPWTESEIIDATSFYQNESFEKYTEYCRGLATDFKKWASFAKLGQTNWFEGVAANMKATVLVMALIALPGLLGAQKTAQVKHYLGDRTELLRPESGKEVSFLFERREISITANGSSTPIELLKSVPFFSDASNDGRLLAIKIGGQLIVPTQKPVAPPKAEAAVPTESIKTLPVATSGDVFEALPDSNEFEAMKGRYLVERAKDWARVRPAMDYYMWRFRFWLILLVGVGAILWVLAKVTARDGVKDYHGIPLVGHILTNAHLWSKGWLFIIMAVVSIPFALEGIITFFYTGTLSFGILFQWIVVAVCWYKVWEFVLPDTPGSKGPGAGGYPDNYTRRLN